MRKLSQIQESIWSDIQDRNSGEVTRKEDDISNLNRNEFYDYLLDHYETINPSEINIIRNGEFSDLLNIPIFEHNETGKIGRQYRLIIWDFDANAKISIPSTEEFCDSDLYKKMKSNFVLKPIKDTYNPRFEIYPKGVIKKSEMNRFFLNVIDFIIDNISDPFEILIKRK